MKRTTTPPRPHRTISFLAPLALAAAGLATLAPTTASAEREHQLIAKSADEKAVEKTVVGYLDCALRRDWIGAAKLVDPDSLLGVKESWIGRVKEAPTIEDEKRILQSVGKESIAEVEAMPPDEFYGRFQVAIQERFGLNETRIKTIAETFQLRVLAIAFETETFAHVMVRTTHDDEDGDVSKLEIISLVKSDPGWLVTLSKQLPG